MGDVTDLQVHMLEIQKVEMRSVALMKEFELQRRELVIMRYDRQRSLCDQIITRQRQMLEGKTVNTTPCRQPLHHSIVLVSVYKYLPLRSSDVFS